MSVGMMPFVVRGTATPEEVAAVLAVLSRNGEARETKDDAYARWRALRRAAVRSDPVRPV
jgi:hypothetical protein